MSHKVFFFFSLPTQKQSTRNLKCNRTFFIPVRYNKHKDIVLGIHLCGEGDCSVGKNASMELDKQTQFLGPDSHAWRGEPTSVNCLLTSYVSRNIHFHTDACMHKMKFKMLSLSTPIFVPFRGDFLLRTFSLLYPFSYLWVHWLNLVYFIYTIWIYCYLLVTWGL